MKPEFVNLMYKEKTDKKATVKWIAMRLLDIATALLMMGTVWFWLIVLG